MPSEVIVGILSLCGTLIGTIGGIMTTSKLTNYRLQQLESAVSKHNTLIDRMYKVENRVTLLEDEYKRSN
jgi:hypothetical protein